MRWTSTKLTVLAQTCAARAFRVNANPRTRGARMSQAKILKFVANWAKGACEANEVPQRFHAETIQMAVDFYERYLDPALTQIMLKAEHGATRVELGAEIKASDVDKRQTLATLIEMALCAGKYQVRVGSYRVTVERLQKTAKKKSLTA